MVGILRHDLRALPQRMKGRCSHAPRLARRDISAGLRQPRKVANALIFQAINAQQFTTPGLVVWTKAKSVERQAQHGRINAMLPCGGERMRVVVLDRKGWAVQRFGLGCRLEIRVEVVCRAGKVWSISGQSHEQRLIVLNRFQRRHVPGGAADQRVVSVDQSQARLQIRPHADHGRQ